ncbi:type 1 glutamine amidotransferase domain-containing protein [Loigolactobacillus binensis]|uniref:Type 1 glutamine amidotransferase domain-containing protein n=1 Tax=Loigolactobacillus binensis TaxID=2559922 RepID=A0ABW3ECG6_9LACO|nr:type 1 glutamine amidotransferase domain-containing protein [Loigolactobacillus binensis]
MSKVLVVLTNVNKFATLDRATGVWLSEAAHFNEVMVEHNIDVDYVSPQGGYVPLDPGSVSSTAMDATNWKFYNCADFRNDALGKSKKPSEIDPADYDAIYYAGGHGVMWDFPDNTELATIAKAIYDRGGIIAAVCHGVVGLLPITNEDGSKFIAGKNLTGFTNEEEAINKLTQAVPFLAEDELKAAGANHTKTAAYTENLVVDGQLITGQNPQSARLVGEAVVRALK